MPRKKSNPEIKITQIDRFAMRFSTLEEAKNDEYLRKRFPTDRELAEAFRLCKEMGKQEWEDSAPERAAAEKRKKERTKVYQEILKKGRDSGNWTKEEIEESKNWHL